MKEQVNWAANLSLNAINIQPEHRNLKWVELNLIYSLVCCERTVTANVATITIANNLFDCILSLIELSECKSGGQLSRSDTVKSSDK